MMPEPANAAAAPRILVIDDEASLRHALIRGLHRANYACVAAATGREGVDRFTQESFDAVLTDVRLPDISGLDVVAVLTEMDASVPVVVMTGYGTMDTALEAMRRGARDYVQKPFVVRDVAQTLGRALQDRLQGRESRRLRALVERRAHPEGFQTVEGELQSRRAPGPARAALEPGAGGPSRRLALRMICGDGLDGGPATLRDAQRAFEIAYVEDLLVRTGGNVAAAARLAEISRPNFHKKLRTLGVDAGAFKRAARRGRQARG